MRIVNSVQCVVTLAKERKNKYEEIKTANVNNKNYVFMIISLVESEMK